MREAVERADAMLVVGSSVQVYSAFRLVRAVAERRRARGTPALPKLLLSDELKVKLKWSVESILASGWCQGFTFF